MVKCALCPEVFSSNELLQKHTTTHFDAKQPDDILREKLLMQTMRKKKKKKKRNSSTTPPSAPVMFNASTGLAIKPKYKKTYSCLLCNSTFLKKASWRIHKIRHNGKGWKCQFCPDSLHETSKDLKDHLQSIHKMEQEEMEMLGILKKANQFVVTKKLKPPKIQEKSAKHDSDSSSADSDSDSEDPEEDDDVDEIDYEDEEDEEDDTTTNASTPTPFSMAPLSFTNPVTSAAAAAATVATMLPSLVPSDPKDMFVSTKSQPPIVHAPSPTPSSSSGSGLVSTVIIFRELSKYFYQHYIH